MEIACCTTTTRLSRLLAILAFAGAFTIFAACGSGSTSIRPTGGGDRFLLANQAGLNEATANGTIRNLVKFDDASYVLDPAISPDGHKIAFARQTPARNLPNGSVDFGSDLYVTDRDGQNVKEVLHHSAIAEFIRSPAWLSATELLITVQGQAADRSADFRTERLDVTTGTRKRLINGAINAGLSRDQKQLVYVAVDPVTQEETLIETDLALTFRRTLADGTSGLGLFSSAVFSPDGKSVTFAAVDLNAPALSPTPTPGAGGALKSGYAAAALHPFAQDVWSVNGDGSGLRRLSEIAENNPSLTWSGDGLRLFALGPTAFWRIDAATGKADHVGSGIPLGQILWLAPK